MQLSVRDVDEQVFREFKSEAVREKTKVGKALTMAMSFWMERKQRKPKKSMLDLKSFDWGKGTERFSEEADEVLYG